jgi:hypothetical protein
MNPAYLSAFAALAGSLIGGLTSILANWLTQHEQSRAQHLEHDLSMRHELYKNFIEEASRLYADAFTRDDAKISDLVNLYALVSRMRVFSSPQIAERADVIVRRIIATYLEPNKTFRDLKEIVNKDPMDPLREFSNACREELVGRRFVGRRLG